MPAAFNTCSPSGLGCWFSRGLLPAEYALKCVPLAPVAMWLSKASDKMLRAELCVHKKRTFKVVMVCIREGWYRCEFEDQPALSSSHRRACNMHLL